jgi:4-carboxymuconolactone decarboxylase
MCKTTESKSCSCSQSDTAPTGKMTPDVAELVAIGAAIGCNCIPCVKYHIDQARTLGVSDEDILQAVALGNKVKQTPAKLVLQQADRQLDGRVMKTIDPEAACNLANETPAAGKCCG